MRFSIVTAHECDSHATAVLLKMLDHEFLHSRLCCGTLAMRYPHVLGQQNADNIYLAWNGNELAGSVIVRKFDWFADQRTWKGAMLGLVCVAPHLRGQGVGTMLVKHVVQRLERPPVDFAVLWTTLPSFYARLGWIGSDRGVLGTLQRAATTSLGVPPEAQVDWQTLESVRATWLPMRVLRTSLDYRIVPNSARHVYHVSVSTATDQMAYALLGDAGTTGIVYEMVGHPTLFDRLWENVTYREMCVNDVQGSTSHDWLLGHTRMKWQTQLQTMWLRLSDEVNTAQFGSWYIPYFDRI